MKKVMFIGNSHTFFESLPWVFQSVCAEAGKDVSVMMSTYPGCDWGWHLSSPNTMANLRLGGHDYAVIQQAAHPFGASPSFFCQGGKLIEEVKKAGAVPVLYVPWSEKINPDGQAVINEYHERLLCENPGVLAAWCGKAWHRLRGVLDLYHKDGEHQNPLGAYLNACVLGMTIMGFDPMKLPDKINCEALTGTIRPHEIKLLQKAAVGL